MTVTKDVGWRQLPRPSTAADRISYMQACQRNFSEVGRIPPSYGTVRYIPNATQCVPRIASSYVSMGASLVLSARATYTCSTCDARSVAHDGSCVLANPFADWHVLLCSQCSAV